MLNEVERKRKIETGASRWTTWRKWSFNRALKSVQKLGEAALRQQRAGEGMGHASSQAAMGVT